MHSKELHEILEQHKLWLDSGDKEGRQADFSGATLYCSNFRNSVLRRANLSGSDLEGSDLEYADLKGANLSGVNLSRTYLQGANFEGAEGILQWQSPLGQKRICYSVKHDRCIMHKLGCFWGTTEEAAEAIQKKYGEGSLYEKFLLMQVEALEEE